MSETAGTLRCFAACFVDGNSAATLLAHVPRIRGMRQVAPEKLHVTLRFFGALGTTELYQALGLVNGLSAPGPQVVGVAGLTGFSSPRRATTMVVTLEEDTQLLRWHSQLITALEKSEEHYRPHVTVARSRQAVDVSSVLTLPAALVGSRILLGPPRLYASEPSPTGSRYRRIESSEAGCPDKGALPRLE